MEVLVVPCGVGVVDGADWEIFLFLRVGLCVLCALCG